MTDAPERIWDFWPHDGGSPVVWREPCPFTADDADVFEYVRADLARPMTVAEAATHWAITSPSGVHIGLWSSYETAKRVFDNEVNGSKLWPLRALSQGGE